MTSKPSTWLSSAEKDLLIVSTALKLLLFPSYRSTDFEVHRNWLAITGSLPLRRWYQDTTSEWTLDYPPFFAYFEWLLAQAAFVVDPKIIDVHNLKYSAWSVIAFQRSTVILSELVLGMALLIFARNNKSDSNSAFIVAASLLLHPGLIIIDHIHFQYNSFLLGILLLAILAAKLERYALCTFLFASLLNLKHIFVYLAPPFFVYVARVHCFTANGFRTDRLLQLGTITALVCAASFGPFLAVGGLEAVREIIARLFPFQRGLNHAYWAPNAWALASAADRVLVKYYMQTGRAVNLEALASTSRGLVGDTSFGVLPNVTPQHCFAITASFMLVFLTKLWFRPTYDRFVSAIILCAMSSFLFGWHVHEKASMLFLVPLSLVATRDHDHYRIFVLASMSSIIALFPLLINRDETLIKFAYTALWALLVFPALQQSVHKPAPSLFSYMTWRAELLYLAGFVALQAYVSVLHPIVFPAGADSLPIPAEGLVDAVSKVASELSTSMTAMLATASSPVATTARIASGTAAVTAPTGFTASAGLLQPDQPMVEAVINATANASDAIKSSSEAVASNLEFLPLMLTSVYCALGISWSFVRLGALYLQS
ncbi:hypothetical protein E5Q_01499 [Mixia osmundae IAM 14324]|uniref:Alpha-1,3-glucosyltransferase n=1 Tax=Mixia osmundae (strain CBS 9802 / IAM 14324 / JCM 22182 / KY 12970) TaxID=764103 RepID=G7DW39_MIXOS|nr:hypothetical protein E5Q_01499 [Mixia osmundae IAM 14324]